MGHYFTFRLSLLSTTFISIRNVNAIVNAGGGFALSDASKESGLSEWLGIQLAGLGSLPPLAIMFIICIMTATVTEIASNTATANILLPILAEMVRNDAVY